MQKLAKMKFSIFGYFWDILGYFWDNFEILLEYLWGIFVVLVSLGYFMGIFWGVL